MKGLKLGQTRLTNKVLVCISTLLLNTPTYANPIQQLKEYEVLTYLLVDLAFFIGIWCVLGLLKYLCKLSKKSSKPTGIKAS
ncbi:hypothetical protein [Paraglaciecola sp. 2405UD69-4]|uniref:hypothetical protein n=1 Tax=Paraglaciecola sp. 2405UD69-4 TaxID=3391836 RepID=UPI0039C91EFD